VSIYQARKGCVLNNKKPKWLILIGVTLAITALLYILSQMVSPARRRQSNPFEYQLGSAARTDRSRVAYREIRTITIQARSLHAITIDPRQILYVAADSSLFILSAEGHLKARVALPGAALCLAAPDGKIVYIGFSDHVSVYDYAGRKKTDWISHGGDAVLTSIARSSQFVYVADAGQRLVWCYSPNGELLRNIGQKDSLRHIPGFIIPSPYFDLVVDKDDQLWVVNPGQHEIDQFTKDGALRSSWGETNTAMQGFCGCCNPTHLALLRDGSFVTSEKGIPRVKVYSVAGRFQSIVAGSEQFDEEVTGLDLAVDEEDRIYVLDPKRKQIRVFQRSAE
jgi:hypothetical protein